jgi:hypothetical protein
LLQKLRATNPGKRLLVVLDNAPYNHAGPVVEAAKRLRIERKVARNRYYTTFAEFRTAVQKILNNVAAYADELGTLLTERFQLFTAS